MLSTNDRIIRHKVGLLNLAEELGNVSKACQVMGLSRDTFYRYKAAVDEGGVGRGDRNLVEALGAYFSRAGRLTCQHSWVAASNHRG